MRAGLAGPAPGADAAGRARSRHRPLRAGLASRRRQGRVGRRDGARLATHFRPARPSEIPAASASFLAQYGLAETESLVRKRGAADAAGGSGASCRLKHFGAGTNFSGLTAFDAENMRPETSRMPPLWDWLKDNHGAVSALTSLLMVGIWAAYLH